jgi:hypothetical protein
MAEITKKDNICNALMYTIFPSSAAGVNYEIQKLEADLDKLSCDLTNERANFTTYMRMYRKLKDKTIAMDPNGMTRVDATKSLTAKLQTSRNRLKVLESQVAMFMDARQKVESSQLTEDMENTVMSLHKRMLRVHAIDPTHTVEKLDDIAESSKKLQQINDTVNDAMVSAFSMDMDVGEVELEEYMNSLEMEDELYTGAPLEDEYEGKHEYEGDVSTPVQQQPVSTPVQQQAVSTPVQILF